MTIEKSFTTLDCISLLRSPTSFRTLKRMFLKGICLSLWMAVCSFLTVYIQTTGLTLWRLVRHESSSPSHRDGRTSRHSQESCSPCFVLHLLPHVINIKETSNSYITHYSDTSMCALTKIVWPEILRPYTFICAVINHFCVKRFFLPALKKHIYIEEQCYLSNRNSTSYCTVQFSCIWLHKYRLFFLQIT